MPYLYMRIDLSRLKQNTVENFEESLPAGDLDLDTGGVKYKDNIKIFTQARKENMVLFTKTHFSAKAEFICSRCLKECSADIKKDFDIKYALDKAEQFIDLTQDIRGEIILDSPVKFLCKSDCLGLCPRCGQNLNEKKCECKINQ